MVFPEGLWRIPPALNCYYPAVMFARRTCWNLHANRLAAALQRRRGAGQPLIDLTIANPPECGFRYDSAAIRAAFSQPAMLRYQPEPLGLLSAREAVAGYYAFRGAPLSPARILLATGTSEAYSFVFRLLCDPRDEILVAAPSYPLLQFLADIHDVKLVPYPLFYDGGWHIDFDSLEKKITLKTRAIVVVHPHNPAGHFCSPEEMRRLQNACEVSNLALLADEVFLDFAHDGAPHSTFAPDSPALTFTLSGISKISGLPQMKFAWLVVSGPESLRKDALARLEVIADAYLSMNTPVQLAAPALLEARHQFQRQLLERLRENLSALDLALARQSSCSRLEVQGGWNIVLRVPAVRSDEDLAVELVSGPGVHVHPGHFYDFPRDGYVVLSLITPPDVFRAGIEKLLAFF